MRVHLLYFGVLRDLFGIAGEEVDLPDAFTVGELLRILRGRTSNHATGSERDIPQGNGMEEQLWRSLAVAVNREYGSTRVVLREGDEVALLPPVSGGSGER